MLNSAFKYSLPAFISLVMSILAVLSIYTNARYVNGPDSEYVIYFLADSFITFFFFFIFCLGCKKYFIQNVNNLEKIYAPIIRKIFPLITLVVGISLYTAFLFLKDYLSSQNLIELIESSRQNSYFTLLTRRIIEFFFAISLIYKLGWKSTILLSLGIISLTISSLSRSELLITCWFVLILLAFSNKLNFKIIVKYSFFFTILLVASAAITYYQGRSATLYSGVENVLDSLLRYRIYAVYLSELAITTSGDVDKWAFPFFGFLSERLISIFSDIPKPISTSGSSFVGDFITIHNGDSVNALYPWWAWFVGVFGILGLIVKNVFSFFTLYLLVRLKLTGTFFYSVFLIVYYQFQRHPILNTSDFYGLVSFLILDIVIIFYPKGSFRK
ncbi:hypothetical protein AB6D91_07905 [Vibrio cyclitrophicus]